jgi:hypothetical protein
VRWCTTKAPPLLVCALKIYRGSFEIEKEKEKRKKKKQLPVQNLIFF